MRYISTKHFDEMIILLIKIRIIYNFNRNRELIVEIFSVEIIKHYNTHILFHIIIKK